MNQNNEQSLPKATAENLRVYNELQNNYYAVPAMMKADDADYEAMLEKARQAMEAYAQQYDWFDTAFEENGQKGLKDILGTVVVPAMYDELESYNYLHAIPCAAVRKGDHWGLVKRDGSGDVVLDCEYEYVCYEPWTCRYMAKKNGKWGLVNSQGTFLAPCCFDKMSRPMNGFIVIENEGKYGLVTLDGLFVEPIYDDVQTELGELCQVTLAGEQGWLDENGQFTKEEDKAAIGAWE
jgi:hypothetical protein